jgi:hypothetical protein
MFLTGDTAQSIMKGISFRFKDLQSLFLHVSKNKSVRFWTMSLDNQIIMSGKQSLVYCSKVLGLVYIYLVYTPFLLILLWKSLVNITNKISLVKKPIVFLFPFLQTFVFHKNCIYMFSNISKGRSLFENDEDHEVDDHRTQGKVKRTQAKKIDPRRGVTYEVFKELIWPRVSLISCKRFGKSLFSHSIWCSVFSSACINSRNVFRTSPHNTLFFVIKIWCKWCSLSVELLKSFEVGSVLHCGVSIFSKICRIAYKISTTTNILYLSQIVNFCWCLTLH